MEKLKSLLARFKVQISIVAGCLVIATSLGTCSFDPSTTSEDADSETQETTEATSSVEAAVTTDSTSETVDVATKADASTTDAAPGATEADSVEAAE